MEEEGWVRGEGYIVRTKGPKSVSPQGEREEVG